MLRLLFVVVLIASLLTSCSGGGSSSTPAAPPAAPTDPASGATSSHATGLDLSQLSGLQQISGADSTPLTLSKMALAAGATLPASLDFRNLVGIPRDQGSCGSCATFAAMGALEAATKKLALFDYDGSEQETVSCSNLYTTCSRGTTFDSVFGFMKQWGQVREPTLPYAEYFNRSGPVRACGGVLASVGLDAIRVVESRNYAVQSAADLKRILFELQQPVVAGMIVLSDFHTYRGGVYSVSPTATCGENCGGHAVLVVGYSDQDQAFLARNSWGTGWGESGYFRIAYSEVSNDSRSKFAVAVGGVSAIEGVSSSLFPTAAECNSSTQSTAYCTVSVAAGKYVDFEVTGSAKANGAGTRTGSMSLNMTVAGVPCNPSYGAVSMVDNSTILSGSGYMCKGRAFQGQTRIALNAPNDRADAEYTVANITYTEGVVSNLKSTAVCNSTTPSTASCDLTAGYAVQLTKFTVNGSAKATGDGTGSGSMQLVMSVNGQICNSGAANVVGVDNATLLTGPAYVCQIDVPGGTTVRLELRAPNNRADAVSTTATASFVDVGTR